MMPFDDSDFDDVFLRIIYEITLGIKLNICCAFFRYDTARQDVNRMYMRAFEMHAQLFLRKIAEMDSTADTAVIAASKRQRVCPVFSCQLAGNPYRLGVKVLQVLK